MTVMLVPHDNAAQEGLGLLWLPVVFSMAITVWMV